MGEGCRVWRKGRICIITQARTGRSSCPLRKRNRTDITNFSVKRTPKFELVHDKYTKSPIFQFALETDLSRMESGGVSLTRSASRSQGWTRFLDHYSFVIPGKRRWPSGSIYTINRQARELSDWETGEWLVVNGGRMVGDTPKSQ